MVFTFSICIKEIYFILYRDDSSARRYSLGLFNKEQLVYRQEKFY